MSQAEVIEGAAAAGADGGRTPSRAVPMPRVGQVRSSPSDRSAAVGLRGGHRPGGTAGGAPAARLLRQTLVVAGAAVTYFGVRGLTEGRPEVAMRNAHHLVAVERFLGIDWESSLQRAVVGSDTAMRLLNWVYIFGHWPVIAVTLTWLVLRHPAVFTRTRNAMLASGAVGIVVFAALPVAPPRLAGLGLVDTVTQQSDAYRVLQPAAFTNQYAAMPSLHVGWDLLMGLALVTATGRWWLRLIGFALPVAMASAVVLTANHYVLDVIVGASLTTATWILAGRWQERQARRSRPAAGPGTATARGARPGPRGAREGPPASPPVAHPDGQAGDRQAEDQLRIA